jgi:hypothetical protein
MPEMVKRVLQITNKIENPVPHQAVDQLMMLSFLVKIILIKMLLDPKNHGLWNFMHHGVVTARN